MKTLLKILGMGPVLAICGFTSFAAEPDLVSLVNPLQGTDSTFAFSHGNTYPTVALPFPMNAWSPYTQPLRDTFFYNYRQPKIRGIRQTHQPSPWIADYGSFALMPVSGKLALNEEDRASEFRHETEQAMPCYYKVHLDTWKATAEVTPTERCAAFRFTFEEKGDSYVVIEAFPRGTGIQIIPSERKIVGYTRYNHGGVPPGWANHFVIVFDQPFEAQGTWSSAAVHPRETNLEGTHIGSYVKFATAKSNLVTCKVASSYISVAQAETTLQREIGDADFDTVCHRAEAKWNEALGRVRVEGGSDEQRRTFYTALYRSVLFPHRFYEVNAEGKPVYYSPYDAKLHEGVLYTDSGFWDTFRASHPLYNLLFPEVSGEIVQSLLNTYEESGWLPSWPSPAHRDCMIGNHASSLLADAWVKGVRNFDTSKAVSAMEHDTNNDGPFSALGRNGSKPYNEIGYVPYPDYREATAKTLEYAYDDYCAAVVAKAAGNAGAAETFAKKAMNYRNVFNPSTGFVQGRKADGTWCEPFDPTEWGGPFTEGNSWQWTWSVFHDVQGLINLMGGDEAFAAKLDGVFSSPNTVKVGTYGGMIHEMTEMVAADFGQYAHGNQPVQHAIYLYDYVGQPWKTQSRIRRAMSQLYQSTPDGLCGDEDTGQMSAWYVFSALGLYPVCPGTPDYVIGSPIFDKATLKLPNGKTFTVVARGNGPQRPYIRGASWNGQPFEKTFVTHDEIMKGGDITFEMTSAPDDKWATNADARPPSVTPRGK